MKPIKVTGGPWPERIGAYGHDVTDEMNPKVYPRAGLGRKEVIIVLYDADGGLWPTSRTDIEHRRPWTCVLDRSNVEYLEAP